MDLLFLVYVTAIDLLDTCMHIYCKHTHLFLECSAVRQGILVNKSWAARQQRRGGVGSGRFLREEP